MLSARSVAEFCRKEAALLAAISRLLASCRCLSGRSRDFSLVIGNFPFGGFFGTGGGIFLSSCNRALKLRVNCMWKVHHQQSMQIEDMKCKILVTYIKHAQSLLSVSWLADYMNSCSHRDTDSTLLFQQPLQTQQSRALKKATHPSTVLAGILHMQAAYLTSICICLIRADTLPHPL